MDNSQFVLMVAVFMVIATVMISLPLFETTENAPERPAYDCRFDSLYIGNPLLKVADRTLRITPDGGDGYAYLVWSNAPDTKLRMVPQTRDGVLTLTQPDPDNGLLTLTLSETGALTLDNRRTADSDATAKGSGTCTKPPTASGDQG